MADAFPTQAVPHAWHPLFGGRTNTAWHGVCTHHGDIVLKLYAGPARNPLFPNDPEAEAKLLQHLQPTGLAPAFLAGFETDLGVCNIYAHVPGSTWQEGVQSVAALMRKLHGLTAPKGLRRVADGSAALIAQTLQIVGRCEKIPQFLSDLPEEEVPPCGQAALLHSDIVPGNLIQSEGGLHLIDWQCPAVGDPCEDIAVFLSPAMQHLYRQSPLLETDIRDFLAAYGQDAVVARYRQLAPFYHARMAAYCLWQVENDRLAYADGLQLEVTALQRSLRP
ncbi:phosphotransferase [uncultured Shimia sp.]|uniref:phosphotransferase family protein n=1 Tax=uncultured Shimia sp. TaxID=573152 RepID=UPI00263335B1|nr:phosphotransferase [uncultured Shimia sp.]